MYNCKSGKAGQRPLSDLLPFLSYLNQHQTQTPCVSEKTSRVHAKCGLVLRDYGTYEHLCSLHFNISVHFLQFFAPSSPFLFVFCGIWGIVEGVEEALVVAQVIQVGEPGGAQRPRQQMWPTVECAVLRYGMVFLIWHSMIMVWLVLLDVSLHVWWSCFKSSSMVWHVCTMYMDNMVW